MVNYCVKFGFILLVALSVSLKTLYSQSVQHKIDSLKFELSRAASDSSLVVLNNNIGFLYHDINKDSAFFYIKKSTQIANKCNHVRGLVLGNYYQGLWYYADENFSESLKYYLKSLDYAKQLNNKSFLSIIYTNLGALYSFGYDKESSIQYYFKSLEISMEINDSSLIAANLNNIGLLYQELKNYQKAIEYYNKTLAIDLKLINSDHVASTYVNIGALYLKQKRFKQAFHNLKQAYSRLDSIDNQDLKIEILATMGEFYLEKQLTRPAKFFIDEALNLAISHDRKRTLIYNYFLAGRYYLLMKDYKSSIEHFKDALKKAYQLNVSENIEDIYKSLSEAYLRSKNYKNAYIYLDKSKSIRDSLQSDNQLKVLAEFEKQKELTRIQNEFQMEQIKKQNEQDKESLRLKFYLYGSVLVIVFLIVIVLIIKRNAKKKTAANRQLVSQNEIIEEQSEELRLTIKRLKDRESELEQSNNTKDKFFSIIAHDLRNPFNVLLGFSEIIKEDEHYRGLSDKNKELLNSIHKTAEQTYSLLENLLAWSRAQSGHMKIEASEFLISDVIEKNVEYYKEIAIKKKINIFFKKNEDDLKVFADYNMINLVVRNMLDNAIKYTKQSGLVYVDVKMTNAMVKVCITDNGIGISEEDQKKLFKIDNTIKSKGTANESGSGLGLILCKEFVNKNNGDFNLVKTSNRGTTFCFNLPKA